MAIGSIPIITRMESRRAETNPCLVNLECVLLREVDFDGRDVRVVSCRDFVGAKCSSDYAVVFPTFGRGLALGEIRDWCLGQTI